VPPAGIRQAWLLPTPTPAVLVQAASPRAEYLGPPARAPSTLRALRRCQATLSCLKGAGSHFVWASHAAGVHVVLVWCLDFGVVHCHLIAGDAHASGRGWNPRSVQQALLLAGEPVSVADAAAGLCRLPLAWNGGGTNRP
jgi:hypothetical protein